MIATARGLMLQDSLLLLKSELSGDDYQYTILTRQVPIGGGNTEKRKTEVLSLENGHDVEYLLRAMLEFRDAASD